MADTIKMMEVQRTPYLSEPPPSYPPPQEAGYAAPYPTAAAPYPTAAAPYPTAAAPYPTAAAPYPFVYPSPNDPQAPPVDLNAASPYPTAAAPYPFVYPSPNDPQAPPVDPNQYGLTPVAPPPAYDMAMTSPTTDVEGGLKDQNEMFSFDDISVRLSFIRKVYGILAIQMLATVAMSCLFMFHEPTKLFVQNNIGCYLAAYGLFFVLYIVLVCCTSVARTYPINMILLSIFTLSLAYMVAAITSYHDTKIVLMVFALTLVICISVMLFACQTKYDFTTCGGLLFIFCICLLFFGIFAGALVPTGHIRMASMAYAGLGALLFMAFLAFDTQLVMGGGKYEIGPEDYVFAAMMLYVDIIYIFLFLLSLFGGSN